MNNSLELRAGLVYLQCLFTDEPSLSVAYIHTSSTQKKFPEKGISSFLCTSCISLFSMKTYFAAGDCQERAHRYYDGMTKEQFKRMQEFIAGRGSKKPASKM